MQLVKNCFSTNVIEIKNKLSYYHLIFLVICSCLSFSTNYVRKWSFRRIQSKVQGHGYELVVYYEAQMDFCIDEFSIIKSMNKAEAEKFKKLASSCKQASDKLHKVNNNLNSLQPYLHKLDLIEKKFRCLRRQSW